MAAASKMSRNTVIKAGREVRRGSGRRIGSAPSAGVTPRWSTKGVSPLVDTEG